MYFLALLDFRPYNGWTTLHKAPELVVIQCGLAVPTPYPCPTTRAKEPVGLYPGFEIMHKTIKEQEW
ncbi:hypothetical protein PABG_11359 [Paracoccidioides brasiliensis Pb03]|nr:hypothetical protein PABG_11359 [Paracoccidioides brasiliensis Pb03]